MAETNFSGPVNSEAGLLSGPFTDATPPTDPTVGQLAYFSDLSGSATWAQWDGSAWTAVGGGGGGETVILRTGSPLTVNLDTPTAIGQVYNLVFPNVAGSSIAIIIPAAANGASGVFVSGRALIYGYVTPCTVQGPSSSSANKVAVLDSATDTSATIQIVYMGESGGYSRYQVVNSCYISSDDTTSRIYV